MMTQSKGRTMPEFANPMQRTQYEAVVEVINDYNKTVAEVNAATGDRESLAESIRESDEFADVRNQIATLTDQLDNAVNERVEAALANATDNTEALTAKAKELKSTITAGLNFFKKMYADSDIEFPKVDRIKGVRVGGGGGGGKRVRGYNLVVTLASTNESEEFENFASAAKALGMETATLQEQFFAKAGVEKIKDAPVEVSWGLAWEETDEDGNTSQESATFRAYRTTKDEDKAESVTEDTEPEDEDYPGDDAAETDEF